MKNPNLPMLGSSRTHDSCKRGRGAYVAWFLQIMALAGQFAAVEAVHASRLRLTLSPADRQSSAPGKRVFEVRIDSLLSGAEWKCTSYLFHTQSMLGCLLVLRAGSFSHNQRGKECKEDVAALADGRWVKPMDEEYPGISWCPCSITAPMHRSMLMHAGIGCS